MHHGRLFEVRRFIVAALDSNVWIELVHHDSLKCIILGIDITLLDHGRIPYSAAERHYVRNAGVRIDVDDRKARRGGGRVRFGMYAVRRKPEIGILDEPAASGVRRKERVRAFRADEAHVLRPDECLEPRREVGTAYLAIHTTASLRFVPLE